MNLQVQIEAPRLAALGRPIWASQSVKVLGYEVAFAVVASIIGLLLLAIPIVAAFVVGGELDATVIGQTEFAPSSLVHVDRPAYAPAN